MRVFSLFYLDVLFFHVCLFLGVRLVALDGLQLKSFVTWQVDETESIKMDKCLDVLLWANLAGWLIIKLHWLCWQTQSIWAEFPCGPEWGAYPSDRAGVTHPYFSCVFTSERNDSSAWRRVNSFVLFGLRAILPWPLTTLAANCMMTASTV